MKLMVIAEQSHDTFRHLSIVAVKKMYEMKQIGKIGCDVDS